MPLGTTMEEPITDSPMTDIPRLASPNKMTDLQIFPIIKDAKYKNSEFHI